MSWEQEDSEMESPLRPMRARRPVADTLIGPSRRFRHSAVQAEIERRVDIYARQYARGGRIRWLPPRGSGE